MISNGRLTLAGATFLFVKRGWWCGEKHRVGHQGLKPNSLESIVARLKPCPPTTLVRISTAFYALRNVSSVISGGTPMRTGNPKVPKPRFTYSAALFAPLLAEGAVAWPFVGGVVIGSV
jgi:hypothetical protein